MPGLLDTIESAIGAAPQRLPANADYPSDGRWKGPGAPDRKFATTQDMRVAMQDEAPSGGGLFDTVAAAVGAPAPKGATPTAAPPPPELRGILPAVGALTQVAGQQVSGLGAAILGGWRGIAAIASGADLDEAARQVHTPELTGGTTARGYEPEAGTRAAGVAEVASLPGQAAHRFGEAAGDYGKENYPLQDPALRASIGETGGNAVALLLTGKRAGVVARAEPKVVGSSSIAEIARPQIAPAQPNFDIPTVIRQRQAQAVAANDAGVPSQPATAAPSGPAPPRPAGGSPSEPVPATAPPAAPVFVEAAPIAEPGKSLPAGEQARRAAVLRSVGIGEVRESAINGDPKTAATDFQHSKLSGPAGDLVRTKLDNERAALTSHAEQIVRDTGGSAGLDAQALEARGHTILAPLEGFRQWFTDQTTGLYNEARAKAQGQPVALGKFQDILGTDSKFANTDTIELRKGIQARMKELKMIDAEGNVLPATVEQAENLRQYVNEEWSPKNNTRIREIKNALDEDVTSAAGEDTYAKARALHAMKMSIFDDPKGLSSILDSEGPSGINRKVPVEKIADTIANLPKAQFAHIVKTLKSVPPELQPQAQAALAEIKAQFANRVLEAGAKRETQWGARDVAAVLNKSSAKLPVIFDQAELAKLSNLNEAGQILRMDTSYPGAAVQEHNLVRRGAMHTIRSGLAGAGAFVGGPLGAVAGDAVGAAITGKMTDAATLKAAQKRFVRLDEFPK